MLNVYNLIEISRDIAKEFDYSSTVKLIIINKRILFGLRGYFRFEAHLRFACLPQFLLFLTLSLLFIIFLVFLAIIAYIPWYLGKLGDTILDWLMTISESNRSGYNFLSFIFLPPVIFYGYLLAIFLVSIPGLLGFADFFDCPGFQKAVSSNLNTAFALRSYIRFKLPLKVIAFAPLMMHLYGTFLILFTASLGVIITFIPYQIGKLGHILLNLALRLSDFDGSNLDFLTLTFLPLAIYGICILAITILIIPVILFAVLDILIDSI